MTGMARKKNTPAPAPAPEEVVDYGGAPGPSVLDSKPDAFDTRDVGSPLADAPDAPAEMSEPEPVAKRSFEDRWRDVPVTPTARTVAAALLLRVARGEEAEFMFASTTSRLDAIDALLTVSRTEPIRYELEDILKKLTEPPADTRERVRAAKLLLSL